MNKDYWDARYREQKTGWDLGNISPPLKAYIDQLENPEIKILIPGAGNAYEAEYLYSKGFKNVDVLDISPAPLKNLKNRIPGYPVNHLIQQDFFAFHGQFDLILEQTFFCALPVNLRKDYANKMHSLLKPGGKLTGLLFNTSFIGDEPPYGGSKKEYLEYFGALFHIEVLQNSYNSIPPRMGKELFFIFKKN